MNNNKSYPLTGADRFQLFFDDIARRNTGTGNVIRAAITVERIIPEEEFRSKVYDNEAVRLLSSISLRKKWYWPLHYLESNDMMHIDRMVSFHSDEDFTSSISKALRRDCSLKSGTGLHIDVVYQASITHIIFSVNHVLLDYAGMQNLIRSFCGDVIQTNIPVIESGSKSLPAKLRDAIEASLYVASLSGWSMKRLLRKKVEPQPSLEKLELTLDESSKVAHRLENVIPSNRLSFFLGCSLFALKQHSELVVGNGNYFIAVPVDRRKGPQMNSLLSNFLSFIYFKAKQEEMENLEKTVQTINKQTILQAKKRIPEKFSSLLDLFRCIPAPYYKAFIDLPGKGNAGTFAFSLLSDSTSERLMFMDRHVTDITHYPPVISPPGLNIVFTDFNGRLKIILSFDESRISRSEVKNLLNSIRKNLLG